MKIILIGYRASGKKSTIGAILSKKLKIPFIDTDQIIMEETGIPIKERWHKKKKKKKTVEAFRKKETEVIASVCGMNLWRCHGRGSGIGRCKQRDVEKIGNPDIFKNTFARYCREAQTGCAQRTDEAAIYHGIS